MKKMIAILLALVLAIGCTALAEQEEKTYAELHPGVEKYDGYWISEDGSTLAQILVRLDGVEMLIYRTPGQKEFTSWEYLLTYDDAAKTLVSDNGAKWQNTLPEGEAYPQSTPVYEGGKAVFAIGEDGMLTWQEAEEDAGAGMKLRSVGPFEGDYQCDRAVIEFRWNGDHYAVDISWADSAFETTTWQYVGEYDPATQTVTAKGLRQKLAYLDNGEVDLNADREEKEVSAVFSFNGDGMLIWDSPDGDGEGMLFENLWTPAYMFEI